MGSNNQSVILKFRKSIEHNLSKYSARSIPNDMKRKATGYVACTLSIKALSPTAME